MKQFLLTLALFFSMSLLSPDSFAKKIPPPDTTIAPSQDTIFTPPAEKIEFRSNIDALVRMQEERRAKQKKEAMIRIGIGVAFLAVLVIGLSRRRKK